LLLLDAPVSASLMLEFHFGDLAFSTQLLEIIKVLSDVLKKHTPNSSGNRCKSEPAPVTSFQKESRESACHFALCGMCELALILLSEYTGLVTFQSGLAS